MHTQKVQDKTNKVAKTTVTANDSKVNKADKVANSRSDGNAGNGQGEVNSWQFGFGQFFALNDMLNTLG